MALEISLLWEYEDSTQTIGEGITLTGSPYFIIGTCSYRRYPDEYGKHQRISPCHLQKTQMKRSFTIWHVILAQLGN